MVYSNRPGQLDYHDIFLSDCRDYFHTWLDIGCMAIEKLYEQHRFSGLLLGAGSDTGFQGICNYQENAV